MHRAEKAKEDTLIDMKTRTSLLEIDLENKEQQKLALVQRIAQLQTENERYKNQSSTDEAMDVLIEKERVVRESNIRLSEQLSKL